MATRTVTETVVVTASVNYTETLAYANLVNTWVQALSHFTKTVLLGAVMIAAYMNRDAIIAFTSELRHGRGAVSEEESVDSEDELDGI